VTKNETVQVEGGHEIPATNRTF